MTTTIEQRVTILERKVQNLEKARPGRKKAVVLAPNQPHVCALAPDSDSAACPFASIYRHQKPTQCRGDACVAINDTYYTKYRAKNKKPAKEVSTNA